MIFNLVTKTTHFSKLQTLLKLLLRNKFHNRILNSSTTTEIVKQDEYKKNDSKNKSLTILQ